MADVFVSYARSDKALVAPLVAAIEEKGWSVWWDPEISPGQEFDRQIVAQLKIAAAVLVVWTPNSVGSRWVRGEAREGADRGILVPVRFGAADLPIDVRTLHTTDFDEWREDPRSPQAQEMLRALDALIVRQRAAQSATAGSSWAPPAPGRLAICVLPFANMSGDPEQEYFSDGITEDIITDLSKVSALSVISRNSAFVYKGKHVDVPKVARELKVSHVLEGSVRKAGGRVRITAQLVDGSSNDHVWAERYDRDLNDIFALQDEISHAIVRALRLQLLPDEERAIERRGTTNLDAYNRYLMARQYSVTGNYANIRRCEAIIRLCRSATEIDPNYPAAWALLAVAQAALRFYFGGPGDGGLAAAERALALDANLAEAHSAKALVLTAEGAYEDAFVEIEKALHLDSESFDVNTAAARFHFSQRQYQGAIRHYEKAAALVETDFSSVGMLVTCYHSIGDMQGMRRSARRTLERAEHIAVQEPDNGMAMGYLVGALAALGEVERAKEMAKRAMLLDPDNLNTLYNAACGFVMLGDNQFGLDLLDQVFRKQNMENLNWAKVDPDLDPLRDDPRFIAIIAAAEARLAAENDGG